MLRPPASMLYRDRLRLPHHKKSSPKLPLVELVRIVGSPAAPHGRCVRGSVWKVARVGLHSWAIWDCSSVATRVRGRNDPDQYLLDTRPNLSWRYGLSWTI